MIPSGFRLSGVAAGLKPSGASDLGIIVSDVPASAAGVFTTNRVKAAPILWSEQVIRTGTARAIVVNAGNANACTGAQGRTDAAEMASLVAGAMDCKAEDVLVASTGIIGVPLDMHAVEAGITAVSGAPHDPEAFTRAIMTTDTRPKTAHVRVGDATVWGSAKGAGMIAPEMATMLAFVCTDAAVDAAALHGILRAALDDSFNAISVDGCMSTNDCVLALANGVAGAVDPESLSAAIAEVCASLAHQIVEDGEGATKVVRIAVEGAKTTQDARAAASTIADSVLLRCAINGEDPNWGRIMAALGTADAAFDPDAVDVFIAGEQLCAGGARGPGDIDKAAAGMREREVSIVVDLNAGRASAVRWTNDLSAAYVAVNAEYTT